MKKHLIAVFITIICIGGCKTQNEESTKAQETSIQPALKIWQPDALYSKDPYFVPTSIHSTTEGPKVITRNCLEDKNGDMWFATWHGLIHYDGTTFTNQTYANNLSKYRMFSLLKDKTDNLWFGTQGAGVYRYDGRDYKQLTINDGLVDDRIESMCEASDGSIWFATLAGVSRYDGQKFENFTTADNLIGMEAHAIVEDKTGRIWIATGSGISIYEGGILKDFNKESGEAYDNVRTLLLDRDGGIWFGGNDGLYYYDGKTSTQLLTNFVGFVFEDSKTNIWISATKDGQDGNFVLVRYIGHTIPMSIASAHSEVIVDTGEMVFGITEDRQGRIWFGTTAGVGSYDGASVRNY
jgi:ligand-binding sensor domain-containing protein